MLRRRILTCAVLGACAFAWTSAPNAATAADRKPTPAAQTKSVAKQSESQELASASEFAERLLVLEFADKRDANSERMTTFVNELRQKSYPIQRVEKSPKSNADLFSQYRIKTTPTYVLLLDGQEFGRVVVSKQRPDAAREELVELFRKGSQAAAKKPRERQEEPRKPFFGLLFRSQAESALKIRAQAADARPAKDAADPAADERMRLLSDKIGENRIEEALVNVFVTTADGSVERAGSGVAIHYNEEFQEGLFVVSAKLFDGVDVAKLNPLVSVEVFSPLEAKAEEVDGQCVFCDPDAGLAFVAAKVSRPARPVTFLPQQASLAVGENAQEFAREGEDVRSFEHEVLAIDQRRFYQRGEENVSVLYDRLQTKPQTDGSGCFVVRNGRYYFAGLCVFADGDANESVVVPTSTISQALLSNRNLAVVCRDQAAGKFDVAATQAEIDAAIARVDSPNAPRPAYEFTRPESVLAPEEQAQLAEQTLEASETPQIALSQDSAESKTSGFEEYDSFAAENDAETKVADAKSETTTEEETPAEESEPAFANSGFKIATDSDSDESDFASSVADFAFGSGSESAMELSEDPFKKRSSVSLDQPAPSDAPIAQTAPNAAFDVPASEPIAQQPAPVAVQEPSAAPQTPAAVAQAPQPAIQTPAQPAAQVPQIAPQAPIQVPNQALVQTAPQIQPQAVPTAPAANVAQILPVQTQDPSQTQGALVYLAIAPDGTARLMQAPQTSYGAVQQTGFANAIDPQAIAAYEKEEEEFNAAIETLRRRALEGAEIVCIVNWKSSSNANEPRESEVVRLPRRTIAVDPAQQARGANVELAQTRNYPPQQVVIATAPQNVQAPTQPALAVPTPVRTNLAVPATASVPAGSTIK